MKTVSKKIITIILISLICIVDTQAQSEENSDFSKYVRSGGSGIVEFNPENNTVKGTPFLYDNWMTGTLTMIDGSVHNNLKLKHDIVNNWVVAKGNTDIDIILDEKAILTFTLQVQDSPDMTFVNLDNLDSISIKGLTGFIEVLYNGRRKVFVKNEKFVKNVEPTGAYTATATYDEYTLRNPNYYYLDDNGKVTEFKLTKKSVSTLFNENGEHSSFIKKNKVNIKTEEGLIQLVSYLDSI